MSDSLAPMKGTLDVLVLKTLSWGPMHGVEIVTWLEDRSGGSLAVEDSAIYHALHRMQERGLVRADWGLTENNRRARYYEITAAGRDWLQEQSTQFLRYAETVAAVLRIADR
ncbi:PadR family transcriptional regulator [Gemmatirosa kalamazoonensis]|nr:PadR family transcriptional regulator [Gemmatirosa kalamazoonensis]